MQQFLFINNNIIINKYSVCQRVGHKETSSFSGTMTGINFFSMILIEETGLLVKSQKQGGLAISFKLIITSIIGYTTELDKCKFYNFYLFVIIQSLPPAQTRQVPIQVKFMMPSSSELKMKPKNGWNGWRLANVSHQLTLLNWLIRYVFYFSHNKPQYLIINK